MSVKPRRDRRITTLRGALRQLNRHVGIYADELQLALDRNDAAWLVAEWRSRALQILMDIERLAALAAEDPNPPVEVYGVMLASTNFMAGLCDMAGLPDMKRELLKTISDCPISL